MVYSLSHPTELQGNGVLPIHTKISAVFLDIDGTIVKNGILVPSAKRAVRELHQAHIPVILCTGRSVLHTMEIQEELGVSLSVHFNGALAMDSGDAVYRNPLSKEAVESLARLAEQCHIPYVLHSEGEAFAIRELPRELNPLLRRYDFPAITQKDLGDVLKSGVPVYQVNWFTNEAEDGKLQSRFPAYSLNRWDIGGMDIQEAGCDKSVAALAMLDYLGLSSDRALHIGDGTNDVGMFHAMGFSVAMGNASQAVQREADWVTAAVDEGGVYQALQHLQVLSSVG